MRVWGRMTSEDGTKQWVLIQTDRNGNNDAVYQTALAQVLKLDLGESPFYANSGIPQRQTIMTHTYPDFYVMKTQQQYSQYFAGLLITRVPDTPSPAYNVRVLLHSGAIMTAQVDGLTLPQ